MINENDWLECEDCQQRKADVEETHCPYMEDIYGEIVDATLCGDCYGERCMDI